MARVQISPQGLAMLESPHPAVLLSILELLVAMTGALPTHRMVICETLKWLEQHHRVLLDLLQWVSRLPIATTVEPRAAPNQGYSILGSGDLGGALQAASVAGSLVEMSAGTIQDSLLLVFCTGGTDASASGEVKDSTLELPSLTLSGRCWVSDFNA